MLRRSAAAEILSAMQAIHAMLLSAGVQQTAEADAHAFCSQGVSRSFLSVVPCRGCEWFIQQFLQCKHKWFSVPLRGVGCFRQGAASATGYQGFPSPCGVWVVSLERAGYHVVVLVSVPLRGVGCFFFYSCNCPADSVSVPLRGVGCFLLVSIFKIFGGFPSPCGVWVVSLHYDTDH